MASPRRFPNASLITRLAAEPWRFRFFQAVRILERRRARQARSLRFDGIAAVGEEAETVEVVVEPFLVRLGLMARTPRGRVATPAAWEQLGLVGPGPDHAGPATLFG